MSDTHSTSSELPHLPAIGTPTAPRREAAIRTSTLSPDQPLPLIVEPERGRLDLLEWVSSNRDRIERELIQHGGLLFRKFRVKSPEELEAVAKMLSPDLLKYNERSSPRTQVSGNVYTSTEYPAHQRIPQHNENSYASEWPMKIWFYCAQPAEQGGETPISDSRAVYRALSPSTRDTFIDRQILYVRNFGQGLDLPWQTAFNTTDRAEVEAYCRRAPMEWEWREGNTLRTRQRRPAIATHPVTGETLWFNQAHLFHVSALGPAIRDALLAVTKEEDLPRNTYYGDGQPIPDAVLDEIRRAYENACVVFPWQKGDVLLLDNMLVAHGRMPFTGSRTVLVAMAEPRKGTSL